jgi:hypothetical protein
MRENSYRRKVNPLPILFFCFFKFNTGAANEVIFTAKVAGFSTLQAASEFTPDWHSSEL